ncbi:MAG: hypothetical protein ACI4XF_02995 [Oscillospiraceae bacterium]
MNNSDFDHIELLMSIKECTENGSKQDFAALNRKLIQMKHGMPMMNCGFSYSDYEAVLDDHIPGFLSAYAAKYPEEFSCCTYSDHKAFFNRAVINEIIGGSREAFTIADVILKSQEAAGCFSEILSAAIICGNDDFADYYIGHSKDPSSYISPCLVNYLFKKKKYGYLDKIFEHTSREELKRFGMNYYPSDFRLDIDCLYELGMRYLPELSSSDDVSRAASEFMCEMGISAFLNCIPDVVGHNQSFAEAWEFMKAHDIKFLNITSIMTPFSRSSDRVCEESERILRNNIIPLLADEVYIDIADADALTGNDQKALLNVIGIIGKDRITLDLTGKYASAPEWLPWNNAMKENGTELHISYLLRADLKVRIDDDIVHSRIIHSLLKSSRVLEHVLRKTDISDGQLNELIGMCVENKYLGSLNVIRKYMNLSDRGT